MRGVILLPLFVLGACSLGGKPPKVLATLLPAQVKAAGDTRTASIGDTLTVLTPFAPPALQTVRVPVYSGAPTLSYVKDVAWNDVPARLMQTLIAETITATSGRVVLDTRQTQTDPGTRLSGTLVQFGIDATRREAVVTFDATVVTATGVRTQRFEAREPLAGDIGAQSVTAPLNTAANKVAAAVARWI